MFVRILIGFVLVLVGFDLWIDFDHLKFRYSVEAYEHATDSRLMALPAKGFSSLVDVKEGDVHFCSDCAFEEHPGIFLIRQDGYWRAAYYPSVYLNTRFSKLVIGSPHLLEPKLSALYFKPAYIPTTKAALLSAETSNVKWFSDGMKISLVDTPNTHPRDYIRTNGQWQAIDTSIGSILELK